MKNPLDIIGKGKLVPKVDGDGRRPKRHQRAKMVVVETSSEGKPSMGRSIRNFAALTRVGLDPAKRVFQVHAVDANRYLATRLPRLSTAILAAGSTIS
ncbi:MAG: hypothetical protein ACLQFI_17615 [Methylocella sp.]